MRVLSVHREGELDMFFYSSSAASAAEKGGEKENVCL